MPALLRKHATKPSASSRTGVKTTISTWESPHDPPPRTRRSAAANDLRPALDRQSPSILCLKWRRGRYALKLHMDDSTLPQLRSIGLEPQKIHPPSGNDVVFGPVFSLDPKQHEILACGA